MARQCTSCGADLPVELGRGRPRSKCVDCSPPRRLAVADEPAPAPVQAAGLLAKVRRQLEDAGRQDTVCGIAALEAARSLEDDELTGSARAQLLAVMTRSAAEALEGSAKPDALLDELRARRERASG